MPTVACVEGDSYVVRCLNHHLVGRARLGSEPVGHQKFSAWLRKLETCGSAPPSW